MPAVFAVLAISVSACNNASKGSAIRPFFGFEIVDLNNDGTDDIVGASTNGMAVVDGKTFKARLLGIKPPELWRLINGTIVTTARETPRSLQVVELRTGKVFKTFQLPDNVSSLQLADDATAASADDNIAVRVQLRDQHVYLLDLTTLRLTEQVPPLQARAAPALYQPIFCASTRAACSWDDKTNTSPNVATVTQGGHRVSVRIKQPGTRELSVVCFDANGKPSAAVMIDAKGYNIKGLELADGRLMVSYLGDITAYDAITCAPQWQRQQLAAEVLQANNGRLYVTTAGRRNYGKDLIVLDIATGTLLGAP